MQVDERFFFHDDVWLALYLHDVRRIFTCDIVDRINEASGGHSSMATSSGCTHHKYLKSAVEQGLSTDGGITMRMTVPRALLSPQDKTQFLGSMHGRPGSATWNASLRRLGKSLTRYDLTQQLVR